jgi:hypothetical protein
MRRRVARLRIFLSYRRTDTGGHAGRLYDALSARFGAEQVFMDVDTILIGVDFTEAVREAVAKCDVFLALIGKQWLSSDDGTGPRAGRLPPSRGGSRVETPHSRGPHLGAGQRDAASERAAGFHR